MLRPNPGSGRSFEKFVQYTKGWKVPNDDDDAGTFRTWATEHGPPSHSIPPHLLFKAAARCGGKERAAAVSMRLFEAYFAENLDITDPETMKAIWQECGLEPADIVHTEDEDLLQQVLEEHREALKYGANGVPAIMLEGTDVAVTGAHPRELYRRWIERTIAKREAGETSQS